VEAFLERVGHGQGLELADQLGVAAEGQLGLEPLVEDAQALLLQAGGLGLGEAHPLEVGQRPPAPQPQRPPEPVGGRVQLPGRPGRPGLGEQALEVGQVELLRPDLDEVAGLAGDQDALGLAEGLAQLVDQEVQRLPPRAGRRVVPQGLDQAGGGHDLVGLEQQDGQQCPHPRPADHQWPALVVQHLERAEQPELHSGAAPWGRRIGLERSRAGGTI
jgi:hypothetical protein